MDHQVDKAERRLQHEGRILGRWSFMKEQKLTLKLEKGRNISTQEALEASYASVMGE